MEGMLDHKALHKVSYGLYIVSSHLGDKLNGCIVNTLCQVSSRPPCVSVCINKKNLTSEYIAESGVFAISVLAESTPLKFIGIFGFNSGRNFDKLSKVRYRKGMTGCPVVTEHALSVFEAEVIDSVDTGTHTIYIGKLVSAEVLRPGRALTYEYYRVNLRGKTPKHAPTYVEEQKRAKGKTEERSGGMKKYVCDVCGYVYDPAVGDPDNGIDPGTPFEKLPDDWVCPVCGAGKDQFSPEN